MPWWFLYYHNSCDLNVNDVNLLKELHALQMFEDVALKTLGAHAWCLTSVFVIFSGLDDIEG